MTSLFARLKERSGIQRVLLIPPSCTAFYLASAFTRRVTIKVKISAYKMLLKLLIVFVDLD